MATIRELAGRLGVSVSTVRRAMDDLGITGSAHVTRRDARGTIDLDAEACSMLADSIGKSAAANAPTSPVDISSGEDDGHRAVLAYETAIKGLKTALSASESTRAALESQLAAKDAQISSLTDALAEAAARAERAEAAAEAVRSDLESLRTRAERAERVVATASKASVWQLLMHRGELLPQLPPPSAD